MPFSCGGVETLCITQPLDTPTMGGGRSRACLVTGLNAFSLMMISPIHLHVFKSSDSVDSDVVSPSKSWLFFFHRKYFPIYIRYINVFLAREEYTVVNFVMSKAQKQSKKYKEVRVDRACGLCSSLHVRDWIRNTKNVGDVVN